MKANNTQRIFGLDLMRAFAILMVLCSHILWIYPAKRNFITSAFEVFGLWGVEVFFVLSGFLIGGMLYKIYTQAHFRKQDVLVFLKRRWFRTLPNYYLVLIINILLAYYIGYEAKSVWKYFFFLQNFLTPMLPFFPESWSLSVEEFAYLLLPIALLFSMFIKVKNKSKRFISVIAALILFFVTMKIVYHFANTNSTMTHWNMALKSVVIYRIDAILIGVAMAWFSKNYSNFWKKYKQSCFVLGTLVLMFIFAGVSYFKIFIDKHSFFWNVLYLPINSIGFALFLPILSEWKTTKYYFSGIVKFISKVSYSVYLIHYCIVLQLMKNWIDTTKYTIPQLHVFTVVYLIITFGLSFLLYRYYEKPIMDRRDR